MSKVVLIEDRFERMKDFLSKRKLNINQFEGLNIITGELFETLKSEVKQKDISRIDKFEIVMAHQSAWSQANLSFIKQSCQSSKKLLILFSGGISSTHFNFDLSPLLVINVDDFYSKNLELFLSDYFDTGDPNILLLQYGKKWRLSVLMEARNNLSVYLEKNKNKDQLAERESEIGFPDALLNMNKEFGVNTDWYENGIESGAQLKLKGILGEMTNIIRSEIYNL